jgi:hypothetical protein
LLQSRPGDSNRPADPDGWQLASRHHCEHLRPPDAKQFSDFGSSKQQWFQSQPDLLYLEHLWASP